MSVEFSLKLKGNLVNEGLIINELQRLGVDINNYNKEGDLVEIESTYELLGFTVTLINNKKPPYNVYETIFLEKDFAYDQVILLEFNKETDLNDSYQKALELVFNLMKTLGTSALLTSSVFDDICYFENSTNVYIKSTVPILEAITKVKGSWNVISVKDDDVHT